MSRYVIALLIINIYSHSLGNPLPSSVSKVPVSDWLSALAKRCENTFLTAQINNVLKTCSVSVPPLHEKQVQCLSFYEINTRLCDAVTEAKLAITEDVQAKLNVSISVDNLCTKSKSWDVSNLQEYPSYQQIVQKIFHLMTTCAKVCTANDDDILDLNANYFCRYYQWGLDLLSQPTGKTPTQTSVPAKSPIEDNSNHDIKVETDLTSGAGSSGVAIPKSDTQNSIVIRPNGTASDTPSAVPMKTKDNQLKSESVIEPSAVKIEVSGAGNDRKSEKVPDIVVKPSQEEQPSNPQRAISGEGIDKPSFVEIEPQVETQSNLEAPVGNLQSPQKPVIASKPKPQIPDDYQDSEDGKDDGITDLRGDDGDDMVSDPELKQDFVPKNTNKKVETISSFNGEMVSELFPNAIQDGFSDDDDDHFFSFFLTAVIMAIVIYILYHNKSKVSKIFFGLLVEGRQSGRRRTSRGHAYRRLDTLEQAMSTNSAAPPSTIIY